MCRSDFMGRMQIVLSQKVELKLREKAGKKFGVKKGSISKAVETAIEEWLNKKDGQQGGSIPACKLCDKEVKGFLSHLALSHEIKSESHYEQLVKVKEDEKEKQKIEQEKKAREMKIEKERTETYQGKIKELIEMLNKKDITPEQYRNIIQTIKRQVRFVDDLEKVVYKDSKPIPLKDIFVSKLNVRNTEQYDGIDELVNSIKKFGFGLHP